MSSLDFDFYRDYLRAICNTESKRGLQSSLAKSAGCQASYFSQALKDQVHLTDDQAIGLADHLNLSELEIEYFILLIRWEKAGTEKLKRFLKKALLKLHNDQKNLSHKVRADRNIYTDEHLGNYISSWVPSAVHLLTSSQDFRTSEQISKRLGISIAKVKETLDLLNKMGLVQKMGEQWTFTNGSIHVPKESPWQSSMQSSRRQLAMWSILENPQEAVHFSSMFTIDKIDFEELKKMTTKYIAKAHDKIRISGSEDLFCLCLDLFLVPEHNS